MRGIYVDDGLSIRFPGRGEEFNEGVEIGVLAVHMSAGHTSFSHWVSTANVAQARSLAEHMGYRVTETEVDGAFTEITVRSAYQRPKLTLVPSGARADQSVA